MNILTGVFLIFILSYIIYVLVSFYLVPNPVQQVGQDTMILSKVKQVSTSESLKTTWNSSTGSSLIFYINPNIVDRTGVSGNEYASVVQIGSTQSFRLLVAPDAGRGLSLSPALFEVYVKGYAKPDIIEIPSFPLQRWTMVVIVRQGRKFNIYLNGKLAISHMCTAMPDFDDTQPLRIGDTRLGGTISLMSLVGYPLQTNEIRAMYRTSVDTSGKPYMPITIKNVVMPLLPSLPSLPDGFWCPGGNCFTPKSVGPLEQWTSPYA